MTDVPTIDVYARVADDLHRMVLDFLPPDLLDLSDIDATRARLAGLTEAMPVPELPETVSIEVVSIPGHEGDPDVDLRIYRPAGLPTDAPALYWIHGGGMVLGSAEMDDAGSARRADAYGCVVVSVEYRLAPEHPYPAPMHDCYAGLQWLAANAAELGVDPARIAVGGASAGAGLAAGLALMARDAGGPDICFQFLVYPMIDHRNVTPSSHAITDTRVWNRDANIAGWAAYLGDLAGGDVPAPASPSIASDLTGLPPAYINVGDLDLFVDEDIAYAQALRHAGVACELHVYPGAFHASNNFAADSPLSQRWTTDEDDAVRRALAG